LGLGENGETNQNFQLNKNNRSRFL